MSNIKITDFIGEKVVYDEHGQHIFGINKENKAQLLLDVRAYGAISNLFINKDKTVDLIATNNFHDELGKWIVNAINEKLEREK